MAHQVFPTEVDRETHQAVGSLWLAACQYPVV